MINLYHPSRTVTMKELLNPILQTWVPPMAIEVPKRDCAGCTQFGKCCDFQPFVANYLLGRWLEEGNELPDPKEHFLTPLGLIPGPSFRARHALTEKSRRGEDLLCLFYQNEKCVIWSLRPGECSTYFCEADNPDLRRLSESSFAVETRVAQGALKVQGFSIDQIHVYVDELNLEGEPTSGSKPGMGAIYREAWAWARQLSHVQVESLI